MTSRALRWTLLATFVGLLCGAGYHVWQQEKEAGAARLAARGFQERIDAAARTLLEIKSAQPGYVAAGQGENFWLDRVSALIASGREAVAELQTQARSAETRAALQAALEAVSDFEQMDRRARSYVRSGQRLLASDLIFSDGLDRIAAALAALDAAREAQRRAEDEEARGIEQAQLVALAAAAGGGLLLMLALVPLPRPARSVPPAAAPPQPEEETLRSEPAAAAQLVPAAELPAMAPEPPKAAIDLAAMAALCTDLARVLDRQALPAALERAASILNASGIVVWIADPDGRELVPVIAHGYPPSLVARIGRIERDAENVTAAAFRTGLVQILESDASSHGAIAAPLVGVDGPVGVMAAEVLHHAETRDATRAGAVIIAAQLATLMGPPQVRPQESAGVAGG